MAVNEVYKDGDSLEYAVNSAVVAGDFVVLGGIVGVAEQVKVGADSNTYATLRHKGVFLGTITGTVAVGDALYLASAATYGQTVTKTSSGNKLVGYATAAKASSGAGAVEVRINN